MNLNWFLIVVHLICLKNVSDNICICAVTCTLLRNDWIDGKCKEFKKLFRIWNVDAAHRKIREHFRERRINANIVRDKSGKR